MGRIVAVTGLLGALMAIIGSIVAMGSGGVGVLAGASEAGGQTAAAAYGLLGSFVAMGGALLVPSRRRFGAILMGVAAVVGFLLVPLHFIVGSVLLLAAAAMALRGDGA